MPLTLRASSPVLLLLALASTCAGCGRPPPPAARGSNVAAPSSSPRVGARERSELPGEPFGGRPSSGSPAAFASPSSALRGPSASNDPPRAPAEQSAYDLASDRAERARAARGELGSGALTTVVSDVFVTIGPRGWQGPSFQQSVRLMQSAMNGFLNGRFSNQPARAISVYLFPDAASYEAFCKATYDAPCIAHFGFYEPGRRYMVMNAGLGLGTLTHELVHPLVEADFPGAPTWLNEGLASVFEAPAIPRPGEIHGVKNWRLPRLRKAMASPAEKGHARLDVLFGMSDETFRADREDLHYAMARYTCQWLDERGKLWPFYQRWRDTFGADPTGEMAFVEIVGSTPEVANGAWTKWVLAL